MGTKNTFASALADAVAASEELARIDSPRGRKLSGKAMFAEALRLGRTTKERALALITEVERRPDLHAVETFQRLMARAYATDNFSELPNDLSRLERLFDKTGEMRAQLASVGFTLGDCIAMVVWDLCQLSPEVFGECSDPIAHGKRVEEVRAKLAGAKERMHATWQRDDIAFDFAAAITQDEKNRGLLGGVFRIHPAVRLRDPDWAEQLIARELHVQRAAAA